jgi:hypothetical protein
VASNRELQAVGYAPMSDQRVKEAFKEVREGRCPEYVICNEVFNQRFLKAARGRGVLGGDAAINAELLNLRKQNKLKDCPTTQRKKPDPERSRYLNAVSNAVRLVERQFGKNVDDVICDPAMRAQFDALVQFLSPATSTFEAEYAALSLRKSNQLKPEPVGQIIRAVGSKVLTVLDLETRLTDLPTKPGVYVFFDEAATLYAGKADSLRSRIRDHISTWSYREMMRQMEQGRRPVGFLVYHELPVTISARELAAYEMEIIRSRKPEHNRAGRAAKGPNLE